MTNSRKDAKSTGHMLAAADVILREARRWDELTAAAEAIKNLGSIEQAEREATARLEALTKEETVARQRVAETQQLLTESIDKLTQLNEAIETNKNRLDTINAQMGKLRKSLGGMAESRASA